MNPPVTKAQALEALDYLAPAFDSTEMAKAFGTLRAFIWHAPEPVTDAAHDMAGD